MFQKYGWLLQMELDSTKVQTLGAISEHKMRQDTAPQLATRLRSYTIQWDTGPRVVYTCQQSPVSRRLAASAGKPDWHIRFPPLHWAASGKGKEARAAAEVYTPVREKQRAAGRRGPQYSVQSAIFPAESTDAHAHVWPIL